MERVVVSWSGGKESALALREVRDRSALEVVELVTMVTPATADGESRTTIHGVRTSVMERQAAALGLPVSFVTTAATDRASYVETMVDVFDEYRERGVKRLVLGDIERDDPDDPRQDAMAETGFRSYCPLLGYTPAEILDQYIEAGYEGVAVRVDPQRVDGALAGRVVDRSFVSDLPDGVDPCGEGGEYHTFVTDGPGFESPVLAEVGDPVERPVGDRTDLFCDLRLVD